MILRYKKCAVILNIVRLNMNTTICCFAGHSDMNGSDAKEKIKKIAERLITEKNVTEFRVGNYG